MKVKRFLSLMLSLALAVSLAAPALAAEEEPTLLSMYDYVEEYMDQHPEIYEAFDADAHLAEEWGDWWTKEEYMEVCGLESEEDFKADMWQDYLDSFYYDGTGDEGLYAQVYDAYREYLLGIYETRHPGELEGLVTEELLARAGYTRTLTPQEHYMEDYDLDSPEEVRPSLLYNYAADRLAVEERHVRFLSYQTEYPETWESFDAEDYFAREYYWDSKEEYMAGQNLTEEEFVEAMFVEYVEYYLADGGYDDGYDDNWYWDGEDYDRVITLYANGETIDTDVTAADGVTYADPAVLNEILGTDLASSDPISIRSAAETAGWDVVWNSYRRQVALLDRERLLTGVIVPGLGWVEEDISGLDRLVEKAQAADPMEPGKSYRTTGTVELTYTALNSLDGDETYTAQLKVESLSRDKTTELSLSMELADLLRLVPDALMQEVRMELPGSVKDLKALLNGVKVDLIWNGETGMLYVNAPIVALVDPTPGVDGDTWYAFDLSELLEVEEESLNVSGALYQNLLEESETGWSGAGSAYSDFMVEKGLFHILFGPRAVTEKNGTLTWKLDEEMVSGAMGAFMGAMGEPGDWSEHSLFRECRLEMTIGDKGEIGLDMALRPDMEGIAAAIYDNSFSYYGLFAGGLLGMADFRYTAKGQSSAKGGSAKLELHWKNSFKLALDMDSVRKQVKDAPRTTPPETAQIVEI